jgi:hypothetical protein
MVRAGSGGIGSPGSMRDPPSMSSPVVDPKETDKTAKRRSLRTDLLAIVAIVSVVALLDSELIAYGVPGIFVASELFHLPTVVTYGTVALLVILCLWLSVWLARQIWKVEHSLGAAQDSQ